MNRTIIAAIILAVGLVLAAFLFAGRYTVTRLDAGTVARTDRWTGDVAFCTTSDGCYDGGEWEYLSPAEANAILSNQNSN